MSEDFAVTVGAGTLAPDDPDALALPHRWTAAGMRATPAPTGAHLLHLAVAGCVLNDLHREAAARGIPLAGVEVVARGGFAPGTWASTGITYAVRVDTTATEHEVDLLLAVVDEVAEIPRAVRQGAPVSRATA
ncbi:OsmC family protein [Cellulomonas sp. Marseille-Q8402]